MKTFMILMAGLLLLASLAFAEGDPTVQSNYSAKAAAPDSQHLDQIVVYYLHTNRRCMTCKKLEAYSHEAITGGFAEQLKDSSIIWSVENFEVEGNEHFAKDYKLYSQSLILSRQLDGEESEWKSLDKIWKLVGDKEEFIAYVQNEVKQFVSEVVEEKK